MQHQSAARAGRELADARSREQQLRDQARHPDDWLAQHGPAGGRGARRRARARRPARAQYPSRAPTGPSNSPGRTYAKRSASVPPRPASSASAGISSPATSSSTGCATRSTSNETGSPARATRPSASTAPISANATTYHAAYSSYAPSADSRRHGQPTRPTPGSISSHHLLAASPSMAALWFDAYCRGTRAAGGRARSARHRFTRSRPLAASAGPWKWRMAFSSAVLSTSRPSARSSRTRSSR